MGGGPWEDGASGPGYPDPRARRSERECNERRRGEKRGCGEKERNAGRRDAANVRVPRRFRPPPPSPFPPPLSRAQTSGRAKGKKNLEPFLELSVSSLRRGHANLLCKNSSLISARRRYGGNRAEHVPSEQERARIMGFPRGRRGKGGGGGQGGGEGRKRGRERYTFVLCGLFPLRGPGTGRKTRQGRAAPPTSPLPPPLPPPSPPPRAPLPNPPSLASSLSRPCHAAGATPLRPRPSRSGRRASARRWRPWPCRWLPPCRR